ncbi:MAG: hypothetical protein KA007_02650 [Candidatus Pacebacteria bacterium]|nr:hypothetical protein [Candidatus Paceibacterota bacterium]
MAKIFVKCITKDTPLIHKKTDTANTIWHEPFNQEIEISQKRTVFIEGVELEIIGMQSGLAGSSIAYVCDASPLKNGHEAYVLYTDLPWIDN